MSGQDIRWTRRAVLGLGAGLTAAGGMIRSRAGAAPAAGAEAIDLPATTPAGPLVAYHSPIRAFDSRTAPAWLGGGKLQSGSSIAVSVPADLGNGLDAVAMLVNCTITETEGFGYLVIRGSDLTGERPLPPTSNINWTTSGQTLANLVFTPVGGENSLEIHAGGNGRTHFIIDVQGYVQITL